MDARWSGEAKYQALLAAAQAANSRRDLSSVLDAVVAALRELVPIDMIGVVTHERDTVRARAIHFRRAPRGPGESQKAYVLRFSESTGGTGDSWPHTPFLRDAMERDRRTLVLDHVSTDPRLDGAGMRQAGAECAVLLPLTLGDEFVGAMVVARTSPSPFQPDQVVILEDVARPVTTAVANALAFEEIQQLRSLLERENVALRNEIVEHRAAEEKLRKVQEALSHVTRLTTLDEVSASIAHEINQPLAAIVNNATASLVLLSDRQPNLDEVRAALKDVVSDAERASAIVERVRQMSRRSAPQQARCRVQAIVDDVVALATRVSPLRSVAIDTEIPRNLPPVLGDLVQLEQVLLNLVVNALDAMSDVDPSQRRVEIRAVMDTEDEHPSVTIRVADRGAGLKPEDMPRLFEAFHTTKTHGLGLGLTISRSIVEAHGGQLWAEPNHAKGAVFAFRLPAAQAAAAA
jgi:signal transduction histidine kinase